MTAQGKIPFLCRFTLYTLSLCPQFPHLRNKNQSYLVRIVQRLLDLNNSRNFRLCFPMNQILPLYISYLGGLKNLTWASYFFHVQWESWDRLPLKSFPPVMPNNCTSTNILGIRQPFTYKLFQTQQAALEGSVAQEENLAFRRPALESLGHILLFRLWQGISYPETWISSSIKWGQ